MSESTDGSASQEGAAGTGSKTARPLAPALAGSSNSRAVLPIVAVAISVIALGLAGWAAVRSADSRGESSGTTTSFTDAQHEEAKTKLCAAFDTVRKGVTLNTNASAPGGPEDITGSLAVAANARLAMAAGGQYLLARIDPAAPGELADETRDFANALLDIGAMAIAGIPTSDPVQADRMKTAESLSLSLAARCGRR